MEISTVKETKNKQTLDYAVLNFHKVPALFYSWFIKILL